MSDAQVEQVVSPFPDSLGLQPDTTECRSTLLVTSLKLLEQRGRLDDYRSLVPGPALAQITSAVAGVWLPIALGIAHYRALDQMGFTTQEQMNLGAESVQRMQQTFIGTLVRAARTTGVVTPWVGISRFAAIYGHSFRGGGTRVTRLGEKEVRVEVVGQPLAAIPYFRVAYRGFIRAGVHFFSSKAFCTDISSLCSAKTLGYRLIWV